MARNLAAGEEICIPPASLMGCARLCLLGWYVAEGTDSPIFVERKLGQSPRKHCLARPITHGGRHEPAIDVRLAWSSSPEPCINQPRPPSFPCVLSQTESPLRAAPRADPYVRNYLIRLLLRVGRSVARRDFRPAATHTPSDPVPRFPDAVSGPSEIRKAFPLAGPLPSADSATGGPALFVRFLGTIRPSDSLETFSEESSPCSAPKFQPLARPTISGGQLPPCALSPRHGRYRPLWLRASSPSSCQGVFVVLPSFH